VWVWARVAVIAASLTVLSGCFDSGGSGGLISERAALDIAARSGWHPDRVTARLTTYRSHPDSARVRKIWIVTYRGGDMCAPRHGPGTAGVGMTTFTFTIDARRGKVLSEGGFDRPVHCDALSHAAGSVQEGALQSVNDAAAVVGWQKRFDVTVGLE